VLQRASRTCKASGGTLHLLRPALRRQACTVRSIISKRSIDARAAGVPLAIDAFLDGRDTPPRSAQAYIDRIEAYLARTARRAHHQHHAGATTRWIATSAGIASRKRTRARARRGAAPRADRDGRARGAYARGENDEFVLPTIVGEPRPVADGDAVIFFNFRPDRGANSRSRFRARLQALRRAAATRTCSSRR
jgi:2,3-bisphosphoglycerate-independent phosphoglycerate mutase